jgi:transcriptional regulator with XRE-family HTH domain
MTPLDFKLWRVARGLNQAECGKLFGVSQAAVSWWERNRVPEWVVHSVNVLEYAK